MHDRVKVTAKKPEARKSIASQAQKSNHNSSISSPIDQILSLQKTIGNQAVQRMMKSRAIQAKLRISQPRDIYEQEADRVAEQVMRMPEPHVQRQTGEEKKEEELIQPKPLIEQITPLVQRQVEPEEEEEEEILRTKGRTGQIPEVTPENEFHIQSLKGGGQPLPKSVRAFFEPRFDQDFSRVRVHTGMLAADTAQAANAQAFTVGHDVVFGKGQYAPETDAGRRLLAHEFTHVVQQSDQRNAPIIQREQEKELKKTEGVLAGLTAVSLHPTILSDEELKQAKEQAEQDIVYLSYLVYEKCTESSEENEFWCPNDLCTWWITLWKNYRSLEEEFSKRPHLVFERIYQTEVTPIPGGGCLIAAKKGIRALLSEEEYQKFEKKKPRTITQIRKILDKLKKIGEVKKFTFEEKTKWKKFSKLKLTNNEHTPEQVNSFFGDKTLGEAYMCEEKAMWETIVDHVNEIKKGWHFFGMELIGGWHSVLLAVDYTGRSLKIFWMDQYSAGGYSAENDVTTREAFYNKLQDWIISWEKYRRKTKEIKEGVAIGTPWETRLWQILGED